MPITVKLLDMVRSIKESGVTSLIENAKAIGISERNLRYKIDDYNYYLKQLGLPEIEIRKRELVVKNSLEEIVERVAGNMSLYSFTKEEREKVILTDIFFNNEKTTLENLENKCEVSELTLRNDLKALEDYVKTFIISLDMKTLNYYGEEKNIRRLFLDILLKNYTIRYLDNGKIKIEKNYQYGFFICWNKMDEYFSEENIEKAVKILKQYLMRRKKQWETKILKFFFFTILIALKRHEEYPIKFLKNMEFLEKSEEYSKVEKTFSEYGFSKVKFLT